VTIEKGRAWGRPARELDAGPAVEVHTDAEARAVVEEARRANDPVPPVLLLGGDLARTVGATPRSHPNDGRLDVLDVDASMSLTQRWKAYRRLPTGTHVPHPAIHVTRVAALQATFGPPLDVWLDGTPTGPVRNLSLRVEPDALTVII